MSWIIKRGSEIIEESPSNDLSFDYTFPDNDTQEDIVYTVEYDLGDGCAGSSTVTVQKCELAPCTMTVEATCSLNFVCIVFKKGTNCGAGGFHYKVETLTGEHYEKEGTFNFDGTYRCDNGDSNCAIIRIGDEDRKFDGKNCKVTWNNIASPSIGGEVELMMPDCTCIQLESGKVSIDDGVVHIGYTSSNTDYIYFYGPDNDSIKFLVKFDEEHGYMSPDDEYYDEAGGWLYPTVVNSGDRMYLDHDSYACPTDTDWGYCCEEGYCDRESLVRIYINNTFCKEIKVIQSKGFECRQMTWKHVYHGNVFDNLPTELDIYGNPTLMNFKLVAGNSIDSAGNYILHVNEAFDCNYSKYYEGKRNVYFNLEVKYEKGKTTYNCPVVGEYPGKRDQQHTVKCSKDLIPITGEGSECLISETFLYPRALNETIHPSNTDDFIDAKDCERVNNIFILYGGYIYKLGGSGRCGPGEPCTKDTYQGSCTDGESDCGVLMYTYCTAKGDEIGHNLEGDEGPKRIFVCTITFKFTLDEEIIDVKLDKVCEGDSCEGSTGGCINFVNQINEMDEE